MTTWTLTFSVLDIIRSNFISAAKSDACLTALLVTTRTAILKRGLLSYASFTGVKRPRLALVAKLTWLNNRASLSPREGMLKKHSETLLSQRSTNNMSMATVDLTVARRSSRCDDLALSSSTKRLLRLGVSLLDRPYSLPRSFLTL